MILFRWLVGFPMAALVTAALFFMMAQLIKEKNDPLPPARPNIDLNITGVPEDSDPDPVKPPDRILQDPPPDIDMDFPKSKNPPTGIETVPIPTKTGKDGTGRISIPGGATITIAPSYPEGCRSRGVEGVVIVQFDVTPEGNVTNAQIIQTPDRCFNRPILKAVSGWKYPPVSAGSAMRYGYMETFDFKLVD